MKRAAPERHALLDPAARPRQPMALREPEGTGTARARRIKRPSWRLSSAEGRFMVAPTLGCSILAAVMLRLVR